MVRREARGFSGLFRTSDAAASDVKGKIEDVGSALNPFD
jgi:hypothetical protein